MLDDGATDGAVSADGKVMGTYCHGLFAATELRRVLLARIGAASAGEDYGQSVDAALDEIAAALEHAWTSTDCWPWRERRRVELAFHAFRGRHIKSLFYLSN